MIPSFLLFPAIPGARVNTFALVLDPKMIRPNQPAALNARFTTPRSVTAPKP